MPKNSRKSLKRVIFGVIWGQRKWLVSLLLIFSTFGWLDAFGTPPFKDISEKPHLFKEETTEIYAEFSQDAPAESNLNQVANNNLGNPMTLGSLIAPIAQASIDFSADDQLENQDLLLLQENSIVSMDNPAGVTAFSGFSREVLTYIVKKGDVPETIAASFNINSDTLLSANGLRDGDIIKPGQELLVLPINGVRIKIGAKDTLDSLAKKYSGNRMEIIAFNNLPLEGTINVGDYIIIPGGEMPAPAAPAKKPSASSPKFIATPVSAGWLIWPTTGSDWGKIHASNGIDIANKCGTPVYAAAAGKVILSDGVGWNGGYGKYIEIQHPNGVVTLYGHSSQLLVSIGQQVAQGQLIMLMGTTGRSTGCHLHFEVRGATNPFKGRQDHY